jgi:hypothetical protein
MGALTPGPVSKRCPSCTEPSPVIAMPSPGAGRATAVDRGMRPYQCGALPARRHRVVHSLGRVGSQTTADNGDGCFDAGNPIEAVSQLHRALPGDCNAITGRGPCNGSRSGCDPTNAGPCRRDGIGSCIALGRVGSQTTADNGDGCFDARSPIEAVPKLHRALPGDCNASPNAGHATAVDRDATLPMRGPVGATALGRA